MPVGRLAFTSSLLVVTACTDPTERPATWTYVHAAIVAPSCATASCHSELAATAGLVLDDPDVAYHALLDRQYVLPGDPDSPLVFLLDGDERPRMPPDAPLPAGDRDLIVTWIVDGAVR
jgi:Planctomycete cytochrome C